MTRQEVEKRETRRAWEELQLTLHLTAVVVAALLPAATIWLWRAHDDRVIGVGLDMLLEILWALERLATEFTFVGFERDVDAYVRCDVIALDSRGTTTPPLTGEVEVVRRLPANVALADMFLVTRLATRSCLGKQLKGFRTYIESLGRRAALSAALPLALQVFTGTIGKRSAGLADQRSLALLLWDDILWLLRISHF